MGPSLLILTTALWLGAASGDRLQLALLERPEARGAMGEVPLHIIDNRDLVVFNHPHITGVSRSQPLVTCSLRNYRLDATPAVEVVLKTPMLVTDGVTPVDFPSKIWASHGGLPMTLSVGALLAPVPQRRQGPFLVRVVYAIPSAPLVLHYPYRHHQQPLSWLPGYGSIPEVYNYHYSPVSFSRPNTFQTVIQHNQPTVQYRPHYRPQQEYQPQPEYRPQPDSFNLLPSKKPVKGPLVTVLHFPEQIASPDSLYYQPETEDELGNRNPPEGLVPAGIVQSAQPKPSLEVFVNSKESPLLQTLRDESESAKRVKTATEKNSIVVEAL